MLLKLSSTDKFSQNLKWSEDDSSSTHTWIYTYLIVARFLYALWCGSLLFYLLQRQCEKPVSKIKQIVFPHLFIYAHLWEQMSANILIMTKMQYNGEDPKLSEFFVILIVLVVIGIAAWLFS